MNNKIGPETFYYQCIKNAEKLMGDPYENWNYRYRLSLEANNLRLTNIKPDPILYFLEAPWPTSQEDGSMHTPKTDKYAWPVPSWIVPV